MNKITKAERQCIQSRANGLIQLDDDGMATNLGQVVQSLIAEFDISRDRARRHAAKAARLSRRLRG